MKQEEIRAGVIATIRSVAPEVEASEIEPARPLREQIDLDSMDWLNVIVGFHERFKVDIPEGDYARLVSLDDVVGYLAGKLGG